MIRFFAAHPTIANILMLIILLLGAASLPSLNKETFPEIKFNQVQVTVAYPGASASEVEEGICNRLEDSTDGISFLDERRCEARDNVGIMILDMQEIGDIKQFMDDVISEVDAIDDFPYDAEDPVLKSLGAPNLLSASLSMPTYHNPNLKHWRNITEHACLLYPKFLWLKSVVFLLTNSVYL